METLGHPIQQVWAACLDLAIQTKGILGLEDGDGGEHRLLFISGDNLEFRFGRWFFVDRWLALSVRPITEGSTEVAAAFVSPDTVRVAPFSSDRLPQGFKGDKLKSVSLASGDRFIAALRNSLAEDVYLRQLTTTSERRERGIPRTPPKQGKGSESLEQKRGNLRSAIVRREQFILNLPRLEERIASMIEDLARVAKQPSRETKVFIVVGPFYATHVESNGDIFITTGLLDKVHNVDELAGVLAHELSHLYLNHGSRRARGLKFAGMSTRTILTIGTLGGAVIGGILPTSTKPRSETPQMTLLSNREVLVGAAVGVGGMYLGTQIGTGLGLGVGSFTIQQFSRDEELEADDYGTELLWAAGYDYHKFLEFLQSNVGLLEAPRKKRS